jgi:integrase
MSVWKDKSGRYHAAIQRGGPRIHRKLPPQATWRDAKRKEAEILSDFDAAAAKRYLIQDGIARWLKEDVAHQKGQKGTEAHAFALAEYVEGRELSEVVAVAERYKRACRGRLTNSTINRRLAILRRVANLAFRRWGWLQEPLGLKLELLAENPAREAYLTRSELARLLLAIPLRSARRAALVAAFTGLRRGELLGLRHINIQGDLIYLKSNTKTGKPRVVPIVHHVRFALKRLPFGIHKDTLTHIIARAGNGIRLHDLRHTAASLLVQAGIDLYRVGAILGHSDTRTTKRYAHLAVNDLRAAMATLGRKSGSVS